MISREAIKFSQTVTARKAVGVLTSGDMGEVEAIRQRRAVGKSTAGMLQERSFLGKVDVTSDAVMTFKEDSSYSISEIYSIRALFGLRIF